jgi:hypothetical protein
MSCELKLCFRRVCQTFSRGAGREILLKDNFLLFFLCLLSICCGASSRSRCYHYHPRHLLCIVTVTDARFSVAPSYYILLPLSDIILLIHLITVHHAVLLATHLTGHSMPTARSRALPFGCEEEGVRVLVASLLQGIQSRMFLLHHFDAKYLPTPKACPVSLWDGTGNPFTPSPLPP